MIMQPLPASDSPSTARRIVSDLLFAIGREDLVDDAAVIISELVANGMMHARTQLSLSVEAVGDGIRMGVTDGSPVLPRWAPGGPESTSGRGLLLVECLAARWGATPLPGGGKTVWAQLDQVTVLPAETTEEELLARWAEDYVAVPTVGDPLVAIDFRVDVALMLDSRSHTEELVRDLQLVLLGSGTPGVTAVSQEVVELARRLDAATRAFAEPREQMLRQTLQAERGGATQVTLHLLLRREDRTAAGRWMAAIDEAEVLASTGALLTGTFPAVLTAFRHAYIATIVDELGAPDRAA